MTIRVENLSYVYGKGTLQETTAINDVSFTIESGELVGIVGHTGSGKTTLIRHLNGLLKPTAGKVLVDDIDTKSSDLRILRKKVGLVFQIPENQLFEGTVYDEIAFGLRKNGLDEKRISEDISKLADEMGFSTKMLQKSPFELSNGQKRRVALGSVIITNPSILVMDEPTAGLDGIGQEWVSRLIAKLRKTTTVVIVSHSLEYVSSVVDRVIVLNKGQVIIDDKTSQAFGDIDRIKAAGLLAPQITFFMSRLKELVPEVSSGVFTPRQAAEEIYEKLPWVRNPRLK